MTFSTHFFSQIFLTNHPKPRPPTTAVLFAAAIPLRCDVISLSASDIQPVLPDFDSFPDQQRKIAALETKVVLKNEVVAELLEEHVQLKKELGPPLAV